MLFRDSGLQDLFQGRDEATGCARLEHESVRDTAEGESLHLLG